MVNRVYSLERRQKAAELASELFGTEITVDLREEDINIDSNLNDQMIDKEEIANDKLSNK